MRAFPTLLISALAAAAATASLAQSPSPTTTNGAPSPSSPILGGTSGAFIALSVADLDKTVAWYRDELGFEVFDQGTAPNRPADQPIRFALLKTGDTLLEVLQFSGSKPRLEAAPFAKDSVQIQGFFKSGFVVEDIDAIYRRLQGRKVPFAYELGQPRNNPYRSFGVRDPEGNLLQFFGK
jgi:catechol 2,3-dioxygenase-like lactoylglutathione lyase family enzyme